MTLPTLLAIKYFPPFFFSPASLYSGAPGALAAKDSSPIYEKATKDLGTHALLSSTVLSMNRSAADLVKITVQTPSGKNSSVPKSSSVLFHRVSQIPSIYHPILSYTRALKHDFGVSALKTCLMARSLDSKKSC